MILQKIFSDLDGEERLYSVLLDEEEIALFSEDDIKDIINPSVRNGALVIAGGYGGNKLLYKKAFKEIYGSVSEADSKIADKLVKEAKERGIKFVDDKLRSGGPAYGNGKVYRNGTNNASSLAHELGHAHYSTDKNAGKIGKAAHKIYEKKGASYLSEAATLGGVLAGAKAGINKARREERGEKEGKIMKHAGWATPLLLNSPTLVSEALASKKGLKLLKEAGASKELMKSSKKHLGTSFGTYATMAAINSGIGELAKGAAYKIEKNRLKKERSKKKK